MFYTHRGREKEWGPDQKSAWLRMCTLYAHVIRSIANFVHVFSLSVYFFFLRFLFLFHKPYHSFFFPRIAGQMIRCVYIFFLFFALLCWRAPRLDNVGCDVLSENGQLNWVIITLIGRIKKSLTFSCYQIRLLACSIVRSLARSSIRSFVRSFVCFCSFF